MTIPRRPSREQEQAEFIFSHPEVTATTLTKEWLNKSGRQFKVDKISYVNPTGLAGHADNHFAVQIKQGSVVVGAWSTDSDVVGQGTIAANTWIQLVLSATPADLIVEPDEGLDLNLLEGGTATLPVGKVVVCGRFL